MLNILSVSVIHIVDRPVSFSILFQKQTGNVGNTVILSPNFESSNQDNRVIFNAMVDVIKTSEKDKVSHYHNNNHDHRFLT